MTMIRNLSCYFTGHDWESGQMFSDGWTDTCQRCGETREVDR